jgi:L-alanine-DL-glutamate epimerase-like enolase superfamily enzyme
MEKLSRRQFVSGAALASATTLLATPLSFASAAAGGRETRAVRIEKIDIFPVRYPTVMPFRFIEGPAGGGRPAVLVKVTADDGTVGWGESVPVPRWSYETLEAATIALDRYLAPVIVGRDPFDLKGIHDVMNREIAPSFTTGMPITKSGLDIALHDLIGKITGRNIADLWGRKTGDELVLSWTLQTPNLQDLDRLIDEGLAKGFEHFNVKVAPDPHFDLAMVRHVRKRIPDGFLWADANGQYTLADALWAAPRLAGEGVPVLEQPIPISQISGYQRLVKQAALPILVDEGMVAPNQIIEYIKLGCMDGVAMKPSRTGGLVSARQQIEIVESAGLLFLGSGLTDPDVALAASLILYSAYGLKYPAALNGPQFLGESIITEPFRLTNGRVRVPKGPGLGITVDEEKLQDLVRRSRSS